jgi:NAD(P)-dependent dehydrogenase (short-subunit alcohol dehydrogenase family)
MKQRILVTGASSGLGMSTAARLAEAGYAVVASMRTPAKSHALRAELDRRKTTAEVLQLDVTSPQSVINAMAHLEATGGLDVLINNAGVQGQGFLEYLDDATFKRVFETNFFGLVRTTRAALPLLRKSPNARVINVSSLAGLAGYPAGTAYSSSKWAVEGFSESLHYELLPFGIQVCVVEPGGYETEIFRSNAQHSRAPAGSVYAPLQAALDKSYQSLRRRNPEDFANAVLDLVCNPAPPFRTRTSDDVRRVYRLRRLLPFSAFSSLFWRKAFPDLARTSRDVRSPVPNGRKADIRPIDQRRRE